MSDSNLPTPPSRRWILHGAIWIGVMLIALFVGQVAGWRPGAVAFVLALALFIGSVVTLSTRETPLSKVMFAVLVGLGILVVVGTIIFGGCGIVLGPKLF